MAHTKVPLSEAATLLGLSLDTARKKVQRGKLPAEKDGNRWYVLMDAVGQVEQDGATTASPEQIQDTSRTEPEVVLERPGQHHADEVAVLREFLTAREEEIGFLRSEMGRQREDMSKQRDQWAEESRRKDVIIAELTQQLKALPAQVKEEVTATTPPPPTPRRSWWQRLWGME